MLLPPSRQFFAVLLGLVGFACSGLAQGPLTPPGAPAPLMKTLDQVQPRTPLGPATSTITINLPGSYYLTGDVAVATGDGIVIAADNVTLDLNGFKVSSSAAAPTGTGVLLSGDRSGFHLRNGHIRGTVTFNGTAYSGGGFNNGVLTAAGTLLTGQVSNLTVVGVAMLGIVDVQNALGVDACEVNTIGITGIIGGAVSNSHARQCGSFGIVARTALNCTAEITGGSAGIQAAAATNCFGKSSGGGTGLSADTATGCVGLSQSGVGISASVALGSYGTSGSNVGISANAATDCQGTSGTSMGISAVTANGCWGASSTSIGIAATTATGCFGESNANRGISADVVTASLGRCSNGGSFGIVATHLATGSYGFSQNGTGIMTYIANGCRGQTGGGASSVAASFKYNMPP